jgi:hypothetical protein
LEQQPPLHGWVGRQVVVQTCRLVSQALPAGQSADELQPHAPATHTWPLPLAVQSRQTPPDGPHTLLVLPVAQVVPLQQPPSHGCEPLQVVTQVCVDRLHDEPLGQSPGPLQPQAPPPVAVRHTRPRLDEVQSTQAAPPPPQFIRSVPAAQVPLLQQPPLHGWLALHTVVQVCELKSQAWLTGQSVCTLHAQPPLTQAWPLVLALQSMQALPVVPQVVPPRPVLQVPLLQQPPLHG